MARPITRVLRNLVVGGIQRLPAADSLRMNKLWIERMQLPVFYRWNFTLHHTWSLVSVA